MLPGAMACTVPPLKNSGDAPLLSAVGVAVMVTVAVDPDCSEIGPQLKLVLADPPLLQVPVLMLPEILVSGTWVTEGLKLPVITMLLAGSGPLFVIV